jgi:ATP citrate (pro-S)-lyase
VDVGDVDAKAARATVALAGTPSEAELRAGLLSRVADGTAAALLASFIIAALRLFRELNFVYMEINPLVR